MAVGVSFELHYEGVGETALGRLVGGLVRVLGLSVSGLGEGLLV